jgi:vancomycin resistance protein YoaR
MKMNRYLKHSKKIWVSFGLFASLIMLSYLISLSYSLIVSDKIHHGVTVDGIDASHMTKEELQEHLLQKYQVDLTQKEITLKAGEYQTSFDYHSIRSILGIDEALNNAHDFGRDGSFLSRFKDLSQSKTSKVQIPVKVHYDKEIVREIVSSLAKDVYKPAKNFELMVEHPSKVTLIDGTHGEFLDIEKILPLVDEKIQNFYDGVLPLNLTLEEPQPLLLAEVYETINTPPIDASTKVVNNTVEIIPHKLGRSISYETLEDILGEIKSTDSFAITLPVVFTSPALTDENLKALIFRDSLAYFHTQFYTGTLNNDNRKTNIILASNKINGTVLNPGDIFSFNKIVGPRTAEFGFQGANSYIGGEIVESTGGGICQVSSTLYNAVFLSNLRVMERYHHMFTVGYVPLGQDAAVAYDANVDFRFQNTSSFPIRLVCWVSEDNKVHFELWGTDVEPDKNVEFKNIVIKETPAPVETIQDASLEKGVTQVIQEGMKGFIVDTYKITKINGEVVDESKIGRNSYDPYPRKIKVGTKAIPSKSTPAISLPPVLVPPTEVLPIPEYPQETPLESTTPTLWELWDY